MKSRPLFRTLILAFALLFTSFTLVKAQPPLPSGFYGTAQVNGENVPEGTIVGAWIDGVQYATTDTIMYEGFSVYSFDVPGDDPATSGLIEGGVAGDTIVFKIGDIEALQTGTWSSGSNVNLDLSTQAVTVTANPQTKEYGNADPELTYTYAPDDPPITFSGSLSRDAGEDVGTYAINVGTLAADGYAIQFVSDDLTITEKTIDVTADAKSKVYGVTDPALTYQYTPDLATGDSFSGALARVAGDDVGTYPIGQGSLALSSNYILNFTGANLTITVKPITVTSDSKEKVYGAADPELTYQAVPALISGDSFTGALQRVAGENVGYYDILAGTLAIDDGNGGNNYNLTYVANGLTITAKPIVVTADDQIKVVGEPDPPLTYYVTSGSLVSGDVFTGALTREPGTAIGDYAILQGTLAIDDGNSGNNYDLTFYEGTFTITDLPLVTVTANLGQSKVYGEDDPTEFTFTYDPDDPPISFTGSLSRQPGENANTYAITKGTLAAEGYTISFLSANFTITPKPITINPEAKNKTYGDADPAFTYQYTPDLISGDSFEGSLTRDAGEDVGNYAILQGTLDVDDGNSGANYAITFNTADLTIDPRPITITADDQSKLLGQLDPAFTYQITSGSLVFTDAVTGSLIRESGEDPDTYAILQGTLAIDDGNSGNNYNLSFVEGTFTIYEGYYYYLPLIEN